MLGLEIRKKLWSKIQKLVTGIPVKWDRWDYSEEHFSIFGWIYRKDNKKDFVSVIYINEIGWIYNTSSAKYSQKMANNWRVKHSPCMKFNEFLEGI